MYNWYNILRRVATFDSLSSKEKKFLQAQELLAEIAKTMPDSSPLKNKSYIAGGAVRDEIMGVVPDDIDIVVESPNGGIEMAEYISKLLNLSPPVTYPKFGTAALYLKNANFGDRDYDVDGIKVEFVQSRAEHYQEDSRKPDAVSYASLKDDVKRRDLTINSLLKNLSSGPSYGSTVEERKQSANQKINDGSILDLTGHGLSDIENGIIRTPDNPDIIYKDDPLRILRAIRFSVKYGWQMTDDLIEGIKRNIFRLQSKAISAERIRDEMNKIMKYKKLHQAIPMMDALTDGNTSILDIVFPELAQLKEVEQDAVWHSEGSAYVHTLRVIESVEKDNDEVDEAVILSAMAHDLGKRDTKEKDEATGRIHFLGHEKVSVKLIEERMRELKYPNEIINKVKFLIGNHMRAQHAKDWSPKAYRKFYQEMGDDYEDVLKLMKADEQASLTEEYAKKGLQWSNPDNYQTIRENMPKALAIPIRNKPILNGVDMQTLFNIKPGLIIGELMKAQNEIMLSKPELSDRNQYSEEQIKENMKKEMFSDPSVSEILNKYSKPNV